MAFQDTDNDFPPQKGVKGVIYYSILYFTFLYFADNRAGNLRIFSFSGFSASEIPFSASEMMFLALSLPFLFQ